MTEPQPNRSRLDSSYSIDRLCDEFETLRNKDSDPRIEDFLSRVEHSNRKRLFEQLLFIELESSSTRPLLSQYIDRFPEYNKKIETVFDELNLLDWTDSRIGHFRVSDEIGRGGMGVVYKALDERLDRYVAIKMLTRERRSNTKWLRRFHREAQLASGLNHPNVLTIFEIGEDQDTPYIVTELVEGKTLREEMSGAKLPLPEAIKYACQISNGVAAAHRAGIIHRDLKSENIMIRNDGLVKILDFGLAKTNELEKGGIPLVSKTGTITGTIHFMSPEQARGEHLTSQTDIFSFGVLFYLMITGSFVFDGRSISDILAAILNNEPNELPKTIPIEIRDLIADCLNKNPKKRPSAEQIISILEKSLALQTSEGGDELESSATEFRNELPKESTFEEQLTFDNLDLNPSAIRYAQSGEVNIAWQEIGSGPLDIVFVMGWVSHLEWFWKDPGFASFLRRLATFARVILFDKRGTGLSDKVPVNELPNLETRMDDVRAVMQAAGSDQAVLCGVSEGGPLCALFAATYPDKTIALTMIGSYARRLWAEDYPWGPTAQQREKFLQEIGTHWGGPLGIEERAPSVANDPKFRDWWASYLRMGASPGAAVALTKMNAQIDIRAILPSIYVPTLVIHREGDRCLLVDEGRLLADHIPGAKFVELPGDDHLPFVGDADSILNEIELFLTGMTKSAEHDYVLATVLCIKLLAIDEDVKNNFQKLVKHEIALFRGQHFFHDNDAILVTFDGPVRSVLCAKAIGRLADRLHMKIKCGLDTGTCNVAKSTISGPVVTTANQVCAIANPGEVIVTINLKNLISGSEVSFQDCGMLTEQQELFRAI